MKAKKRPKRLRRRRGFTLPATGAALVLGIATIFAVAKPAPVQSVAEPQAQHLGDPDMVLIPTPVRAIAKGERLKDVPFSKIKWPADRLTGRYVTELAEYEDAVALTPLPKFLPVPVSAVTTELADANAVVEGIPEGMRAITVRVDAESAVEGWARSGNYVDVILIRANKDASLGLEAKVIAESVRILSAGRSAKPLQTQGTAPEAPTTVTLLVTQEDSLKIKAATSLGKLTFALRGQGDQSPTTTTAISQKKLLGEPAPASRTDDEFRGYAKGPDGKVFVLDGSRWIRTAASNTPLSEEGGTDSVARAQLGAAEERSDVPGDEGVAQASSPGPNVSEAHE